MLPEYCAIAGAIIGSLGGLYYLCEAIAGKAQPKCITWLLWGIFPMIIFVAQRARGVEGLSWAAILGIVLWAVTDNPNLALLLSLLAPRGRKPERTAGLVR